MGTKPENVSVSVWLHCLINPPKNYPKEPLDKSLVVCIGDLEISFADFCAINTYILMLCELDPEWKKHGDKLRQSINEEVL
jgi:hypothetical protein